MLKGSRIEELINGLNISRKEFYEQVGIKKGTVFNIINEKASPSSDTIEKIADYFKVPIDYFFERNVEITGNYIGHHVSGNGNRVSGDIALSECKRELDHLKALMAEKDKIIADKERTIRILLNQQNK